MLSGSISYSAVLNKGAETVLAAGMGAGLATILFPGSSPIIGAIVGVAKYAFDHNMKSHHTCKENFTHSVKFSALMMLTQNVSFYVFSKNLFSRLGFNPITFFPYIAFSMLISKDVINSFKKKIFSAITSQDGIIEAAIYAITGAAIFYVFSFSLLSGLAFGGVTLLSSWTYNHIHDDLIKIDPKASKEVKEIKKCFVNLTYLALQCKIALLISPLFFGTRGLAALGAYLSANYGIFYVSSIVKNTFETLEIDIAKLTRPLS